MSRIGIALWYEAPDNASEHDLRELRAKKRRLVQNYRLPGALFPASIEELPSPGSDDALEDAKRVLRADYWRAVRDMAEELEGEVKSGELADQDALDTALWERIDGSYWAIYTHANLQVLCWTENDDAYQEVLGELSTDEGASKVYSQVAFCAMLADVQSYIADDIFRQREDFLAQECVPCEHTREEHDAKTGQCGQCDCEQFGEGETDA